MADGSHIKRPEIRVGDPIVEDYAYVARRMRMDEIEQWRAFTGVSEFNSNVAAIAYMNTPGSAYVLVDRENRPLAIGGFEQLRPGVWETWGIGTVGAWMTNWRAITKQSRRLMDALFRSGAHRIQIISLATRTDAHHWYEHGLRMTREAVLKGYCANGADAVIHACTKENT